MNFVRNPSVYFTVFLIFLLVRPSFGQVETKTCENGQCEYVYYLPDGISDNTPVLYFFEPGARGYLPVNLYKSIGDKYKIILIASNTSRNGPYDEAFKIMDETIKSSQNQLPISKINPVYISGFSGGSRMASFYASIRNDVKGVIGCGSGFPDNFDVNEISYPYVGTIGIDDMNFMEMSKIEMSFRKNHSQNLILEFDGGHSWPPESTYELAWLFLTHPKSELINQTIEKLADSVARSQLYFVVDRWEKRIRDLKLSVSISQITENKLYGKKVKEFSKIEKHESEKLEEVTDALLQVGWTQYYEPTGLKTIEWWKSLKREAEKMQTKSGQWKHSGNRILNFILSNTVEMAYFQIQSEKYKAASNYADITLLFQPESIQGNFNKAICMEATGNREQALEYIGLCEKYGLSRDRLKEIADQNTSKASEAIKEYLKGN